MEGSSDQFIVGAGLNVVLIKWDGKSTEATAEKILGEVDKKKTGNRFNDGKCDSKGRLWCGTMGPESKEDLFVFKSGTLFKLDNDFVEMKGGIGISNGLIWNEKSKKFYYIDSTSLDIKVFDYDEESGNICKLTLKNYFIECFN